MRLVFGRMGKRGWQAKVDMAWCIKPEVQFDLDVTRNPRLYLPGRVRVVDSFSP